MPFGTACDLYIAALPYRIPTHHVLADLRRRFYRFYVAGQERAPANNMNNLKIADKNIGYNWLIKPVSRLSLSFCTAYLLISIGRHLQGADPSLLVSVALYAACCLWGFLWAAEIIDVSVIVFRPRHKRLGTTSGGAIRGRQ